MLFHAVLNHLGPVPDVSQVAVDPSDEAIPAVPHLPATWNVLTGAPPSNDMRRAAQYV